MKVQVSLDMSHNVYIKILILCTYQCKPRGVGGGGGRGQYRGFDDETHPLPETFSNLPVPMMGRFEFRPACSQVELINAHEQ